MKRYLKQKIGRISINVPLVFLLLLGDIVLLSAAQHVSGISQSYSKNDLLPESANCTILNGISYSNDTNPFHMMDAYLPSGEGPFPALIYIHGGGWVRGNRTEYDFFGNLYARKGIAGFAIDYSLTVPSQKATCWPDAIQDVVCAIRYIKENAKQFKVDPAKIALMGDSAGAQLASLAGMLTGNEPFLQSNSGNPTVSCRVSLVVDYYGPNDFQYIGEYGVSFRTYYIIARFLGNVSYEMNPSIWNEASPATYISAHAPVFFVVHGTNDTVVPVAVSDSFVSKLNAAGVENHYRRVENGDHQILTTQEENIQVRQELEPLLRSVFNIHEAKAMDMTSIYMMMLAVSVSVATIAFVLTKRKLRAT